LLRRKCVGAQQEKAAAEQALSLAEAKLEQLAQFADGEIIGDGRPDYTRTTGRYDFTAGGHKFALLDVPGIEGAEANVNDEISDAVKRAHAVFYVTRIAAAPQKGHDGRTGTLEKIKAHLGAQTEVWTIFNKSATNPMHLAKASLITDDEEKSLSVLDETMRKGLGEHYRGHTVLSALPAFLAVADCLVPDSTRAKDRAKFLKGFEQVELLRRSGAVALRAKVTTDLVLDAKAKIVRSNLHKARQEVVRVDALVAALRKEKFDPLAMDLHDRAIKSEEQVDIAMRALKWRTQTIGDESVERFITDVRRRIYERIEQDIDNDEFKRALESYLREEQEKLTLALPELMQDQFGKFQSEIADVIERFREYAADLLKAYSNVRVDGLNGRFELKILIDNGINSRQLLAALAGGLLMVWNPAGWFVLAVGVLTTLVAVSKALWGVFSTSYRQSQQRKSANENLDKIQDELRNSIHGSLAKVWPQLEPKVDGLKSAVQAPARQVQDISSLLGSAQQQLKNIVNEIEMTGAR
jgi:hypothetical protein